jgi:hypothetical protein
VAAAVFRSYVLDVIPLPRRRLSKPALAIEASQELFPETTLRSGWLIQSSNSSSPCRGECWTYFLDLELVGPMLDRQPSH